MALDPRLECLVEHQGPALRTWQLIMQTTMGKVVPTPSPAGFRFQNNNTVKKKTSIPLPPADEFISLESPTGTKVNEEDLLSLKRKKSISNSDSSSTSSSSSSDEEELEQNFMSNVAPWKKATSYPENALGYGWLSFLFFAKYLSV